jgi:hypothetical protein
VHHNGELEIPFEFQLVSKQVELVYDGILGRNFLQHTKARVCYDSNTVSFRKDSKEWIENITCNRGMQGNKENRSFILPRISEIIEKLPIQSGMKSHKGIYVASYVARVKGNKNIMRNFNKRNEEVAMAYPGVKRKRYTPDRSDGKKRTNYRGAVTPVRTKFGKIREKFRTHCRVNKLSLEKNQTRSSEDKLLHEV